MKKLSIVLLIFAMALGAAGEAMAQKKAKAKPKEDKGAQYVPEELKDILQFQQKIDGEWAQYGMKDGAKVSEENIEEIVQKIKQAKFQFPSIVAALFMEGDGFLILKTEQTTDVKHYSFSNAPTDEAKNEMYFDLIMDAGYLTTPEKIFIEHRDNILAAETKYKSDFYFEILSTINKVGKDPKGKFYIELNASTPAQKTVIYHLHDEQKERAAKFKPGDAILIQATLDKCDDKGVVLRGDGAIILKVPDSRLNQMPVSIGRPVTIKVPPVQNTSQKTQELKRDLPEYDTSAHCKDVATAGGGSYTIEAGCMDMEKRAREAISKMDIEPQILKHCSEVAEAGGGSYTILRGCIDMEIKSKKKVRQ